MPRHQSRSVVIESFVKAVAHREGTEQLGLVASGAAFWLVISACPTAVAVVSLYGLVVDPRQVARDLGGLVNGVPDSLGSLIARQLQHIASTDSGALTIGLLISIALAIWSASAGIYNLDRAIRDAFGMPRQRFIEARTRSFVEAAVVIVALGALALTAGAVLASSHGAAPAVVGVPSVIVGTVAAVSGLYRFAVGRPLRMNAVLPGALAASAGMIILLAGFGAYVSASTHFTAVYGAFGAVVIGMTATYLAVYAILLGAVVNAELEQRRSQRDERISTSRSG